MKVQKKIAVATAMASLITLSACSEQAPKEKFTEAEQKEFVDEFSAKVLGAEKPAIVHKELQASIERLPKTEASNAVDGLLYTMHQLTAETNTKLQGFQEALRELKNKNIDFNSVTGINKVKDETLRTLLEEADKQLFIIEEIGGQFIAYPDIEYILKEYENYMNEDLKAMSKFSLEENTQPFFNTEANAFNMDIVIQRINTIEKNMKKFPDSYYLDGMKKSKTYYYQIYFGTNNSFLVDANDTILPEIIEHYKKTAEKHPDAEIGKTTIQVLEKLKESKNVVTDDIYVFLLDVTGTETETINTEGTPEESTANEDINNAIQKALENNKPEEPTSGE